MIKNALSVDLESFVHRQLNVNKRTARDSGYTVSATKYLLNLFDKHNTRVTFFVLGEIFEWYPQLIEEIKKRGHEIGYHGHSHVIIDSGEKLKDELYKSRKFMKKYKPIGFRAPRMFLEKESLKILSYNGFKYDSSVYGTKCRKIKEVGIREIPVSVFPYFKNNSIEFPQNISMRLLFKGMPYGSGLFMSIFQKKIQYFINVANKNNMSAVLFFHPWQIFRYPEHTADSISIIQKIIYRKKINNTLEYLLRNNNFFPLRELI